MEHSDINCVHCTHVFDLDNLTKERRSVTKICSDVDINNVLSTCYNLEEVKLRNYFGYDTCTNNFYICTKCFNVLKAISACWNKYEQLANNLKSSHSSCFKTLKWKLHTANHGCRCSQLATNPRQFSFVHQKTTEPCWLHQNQDVLQKQKGWSGPLHQHQRRTGGGYTSKHHTTNQHRFSRT